MSSFTPHPLDPPSLSEISTSTSLVIAELQSKYSAQKVKIVSVLLHEPPKDVVLSKLQWPTPATCGATGDDKEYKRQVEVHAINPLTSAAYEVVVGFPSTSTVGKAATPAVVDSIKQLPEGMQPGITPEELCLAEEAIRNNPACIQAAKAIGIEPEQIYADGWSIGWDARWPGKRLQQALLFARFDGPHSNLYAHPLDFAPVLDANTGEVLAIDFPAARTGEDGKSTETTTAPPEKASFNAPTTRERIPPPTERHEYLPETVTTAHDDKKPLEMRKDLQPLHIVQPEGVSFKRQGNVIEWQKWKMHVAFHPREGLVLSTVSYRDGDDEGAVQAEGGTIERPLFYRISLAEMVVPYGQPDFPHYKKFAFDVGEYGLGYLCNSLDLGCDCLGTIDYMDGHVAQHSGDAHTINKAICIHEEDAGMGWKHTDYRVGGKTVVVRNRKLVISSVYTVSNYEYRVAYMFGLDGTIDIEIGLTGILNVSLLAKGEKASYATQVAPQISAHLHQHLFSVRLDPHIDGRLNSVMEQHVAPSPYKTGSAENWAGNAFDAHSRVLEKTQEAVRDADPSTERTWLLVNENKKHYASGKPVGYKIIAPNMPRLYAQPDSIVAIRAPFANHHFWTVPYDDARKYPAGKHCTQTMKTPDDSLPAWVKNGGEIRNKDIISFVTIGVTHVVRPEDYPVMPTEHCRFALKPTSFFRRNPMLDVPAVKDAKSVRADVNGHVAATTNGQHVAMDPNTTVNGHANGHINGNGCHC